MDQVLPGYAEVSSAKLLKYILFYLRSSTFLQCHAATIELFLLFNVDQMLFFGDLLISGLYPVENNEIHITPKRLRTLPMFLGAGSL